MSSYELDVSPPSFEELAIKKPLFCAPGPTDIWPSVQEALSGPVVSHYCAAQFKVLDDIRAGLRYVFQTRSKLVLAISGAGHCGMEAVINNLVAPGETLLIAARGIWDERALSMAQRYGVSPVVISRPAHTTFNMVELELALQKHRPTALFIVHGDSSTGTVQEMSKLGALCHKYGALLLVDTVVSLGGVPFFMDKWEVDAAYTGTQKALSGPAGITPVAFSARAEKKIQTRHHQPVFYFDIKLLADQWNCYEDKRAYHHTMSPPLIYALRAALHVLCRDTLPLSWERHARATRRLHDGLRQLPVEFYVPEPEERLYTVTTVVLPAEYDYVAVHNFIKDKHNILVGVGLGPTAGKVLRIGIMGVNATEQVSDAVLAALTEALVKLKKAHL